MNIVFMRTKDPGVNSNLCSDYEEVTHIYRQLTITTKE